ncbi:hydrogenase/urease accessory protein HupE [Actinocorallia herbida]|uniref:Hydrogenase/urease accessory protein HupE n=1 Tax=Actinocorallia herbida TaxID=58109 RepID=A0A3N1D7W8_9ACTN|nr:HupE/UreJ family protein [Actinocorallia herbida]ROO89615.1 hydrogenase/urease accessory protein HupE [Actinocorallia herbida]
MRWFFALLFAVLLGGAPASAHDATTEAHVRVTGSGADATAVFELEYDLLMKSAWLYAESYEATEKDEQLRQLALNRDAVFEYVSERFAVAYDDARCAASQAGDADLVTRGEKAFAKLTLAYDCADAPGGRHAISSALFPELENFVHSTKTLVTYDLDGVASSAILTETDPTVHIGAEKTEAHVGEFFRLGIEHLLLGLDHLCFLFALLLGARRLRDIVYTATAFTAAHSITFLLAALGYVTAPASVVEPVIAASIAIVAVADLLGRGEDRLGRWRLPIVFLFGLVHGLGFASSLDLDEDASWSLLLPLLSFNLGIEATQLLLIALVHPLLTLLRRHSSSRWTLPTLTAPILILSLYWLTTRALL